MRKKNGTGTALVVADDTKSAYQRSYFKKLKADAEIGRVSGAALKTIGEHMSILAANLEASARTARMVQKLISDLQDKD